MHACGQLTDLALDLCVATGARFVLCPCCYGQLGAAAARPRSAFYAGHFEPAEFKELASGADFAIAVGVFVSMCVSRSSSNR